MAIQPYTWTGKTITKEGIEELWHVEAANIGELAARRAQVLAHLTGAPVAEPATPHLAALPSEPTALAPQPRQVPVCPECSQTAEFVKWQSTDGAVRKAWVCRPCNAWVNQDRAGNISTRKAQGPLPQAS